MNPDGQPSFPPLLRGEETLPGMDPFAKAVASAALGTDPGLIVWERSASMLRAALVLAPEAPLEHAVGITFAVALGLGDAIGALAPPEVAVHYVWPDGIKVNGGDCGRLRAAASTTDPRAEPDWLVVGIEIRFLPPAPGEPGLKPVETCLAEEGCIDLAPAELLESWSRHSLVWIRRWLDDGFRPVHDTWRVRAWGIGDELSDDEISGGGLFVGLDELGGMLVKTPRTTELRPLTSMLEDLS